MRHERFQANPVRNNRQKRPCIPHSILLLFCLYSAFIFHCQPAQAAAPVSARYLSTNGDTIRLQLSVSSPSPQSLILEQYLPPGTTILSTSPAAKQANSKSGVIKWLFKSISPGTMEITIKVAPANAGKSISGTLRYRMPGGGKMTEQRFP